MFGVGDQQPAAFQHAHDTGAEAVEQAIESIAGRPAGAVKDCPIAAKGVSAVQEQHMQVGVQVEGRAKALN